MADKDKDPMKFMEKANKRGEWMIDITNKLFVVACPSSLLLMCIGSAVYSHFVNGYIHPDQLYHVYRIV